MNELSHICGSERYEACADDSAGMQGSPFQRALPARELSADSRGSASPGASDRRSGKMLPASPEGKIPPRCGGNVCEADKGGVGPEDRNSIF